MKLKKKKSVIPFCVTRGVRIWSITGADSESGGERARRGKRKLELQNMEGINFLTLAKQVIVLLVPCHVPPVVLYSV